MHMTEDTWGLEDEANLLDAISDCGYGNWYILMTTVEVKSSHCVSQDCNKLSSE